MKAGGEGNEREWDGWIVSPITWAWVWVNSDSCWWTRESLYAAVNGVTKSWTRRSDWNDYIYWASHGVQWVKNPHAMKEPQETWVQFLSWEDPLEEVMATHSSILAWKIPWMIYLYLYLFISISIYIIYISHYHFIIAFIL